MSYVKLGKQADGCRYKLNGQLWTDYDYARSASIWSRVACGLLAVDLLARVIT